MMPEMVPGTCLQDRGPAGRARAETVLGEGSWADFQKSSDLAETFFEAWWDLSDHLLQVWDQQHELEKCCKGRDAV